MRGTWTAVALATAALFGCGETHGGGDAAGSEPLDARVPVSDASGSVDALSTSVDAPGGSACGTRGGAPCPTGTYCDFGGDCGEDDLGGTCAPIGDDSCPEIAAPVCGCDGETYSNDCFARAAGVSIRRPGACDSALVNCDARDVSCRISPPECPDGQAPSIDGPCWGPCVTIDSCACSSPDDCPERDSYTCHNFAGRCGPYL